MSNEHYVGTELDLFARAHNWKRYLARLIRPHLGTDVLEVGAGLGGTTATLARHYHGHWLCLEPDPKLALQIDNAAAVGTLPPCCRTLVGTVADIPQGKRFDSILYIDVLEHIEDDGPEAARAARLLRPGGKLIILSPALQWLYSAFDEAVGHYRRYSRQSLLAVVPRDLTLVSFAYLDSVGLLASAGNRLVTRRSAPSPSQMWLWDRLMVPASEMLDPLLAHSFGKSALGIWQRPGAAPL